MSGVYSKNPSLYLNSRPKYTNELYNTIFSHVNNFGSAWDCATGSGQVISDINDKFEKIYATDCDQKQLDYAPAFKNVSYHCCGEKVPFIEDNSLDLITVATAIHWLDRDVFYNEVERVLKNNGVLAVWGYNGKNIHEDLDVVLFYIIENYLKEFYTEHIQVAFNSYNSINFPYPLVGNYDFKVQLEYSYDMLVNYILSWSASQNYMITKEKSPLYLFEKLLSDAWGDKAQNKILTWELITHIGMKP